jgi:hypothetical protein
MQESALLVRKDYQQVFRHAIWKETGQINGSSLRLGREEQGACVGKEIPSENRRCAERPKTTAAVKTYRKRS